MVEKEIAVKTKVRQRKYFGGYSIISFCGLYLTARYFKLYPSGRLNRLSLYVYIAITCFISIIVVLSVWKFGNAMKMLRYDNPLIILSSMALLLFFCKFRFQSSVAVSYTHLTLPTICSV